MKPSSSTLLALTFSSITATAEASSTDLAFVPTTLKDTSAQDGAEGFILGQMLDGQTRNWYANQSKQDDRRWRYTRHGESHTTARRTHWIQGTQLNYRSGFTEGTLGIATEVSAYNAIALNRSRKDAAGSSNRALVHGNGDPVDQWSKLGRANLQARMSNTTLIAGRQAFSSPTLDTLNNRALPSSFQGVSLHSAEFDNLSFTLASFDQVSPRSEQSLTKFRSAYGAAPVESDRASTFGIDYQPLTSLKTRLYVLQAQDFWNQYYLGATHHLGDNATLGLTTRLDYYKTVDSGTKKLGSIDNDAYSVSFALAHRAHRLSFAYQQIVGNEYFDYLDESNGITLANSLYADYNGPNEQSIQLAYALDLAGHGLPGLTLNLYGARGWGIDGSHYRGNGYNVRNLLGESHHEYGVGASYTLQSGALKDTTLRSTYVRHRGTRQQVDGNLNELRLISTIPFSIF